MSPEVDTCRQMAMIVAVARYRRHKNLSTAMASPWREGSRRVATAIAKVVQQAHCSNRLVAPPSGGDGNQLCYRLGNHWNTDLANGC